MAWLSVWCEVQICIWPSWCHCHSLSLAPVKSRLVVPYRLTWVVPEKGPLNGRVCLETDEQLHVLKQSSFLHRVAGHKLRILRRFSGHGKLGKFCATSGENCNRVVLVRHSNICVKQLLTGSECSGDLLYCWSWCGMTPEGPDEGHSLLHLLLVVITSGVLLKMEVGIRKGLWRRAWRYTANLWSLRWVYAVRKTPEVGIRRIPAYTPQYTTGDNLWKSKFMALEKPGKLLLCGHY